MSWRRFAGAAATISVAFLAGCGGDAPATERATTAIAQPITSGPCNFSAPPAAGTPSNRTFTIKVPTGTSREEFALATAGGVLTVNDAVLVVKDSGGYASISNVEATNRLWIGPGAKAQNAFSELTGIEVRPGAHLYGNATTASTVIRQAGSIVDGTTTQSTSLRPLATTSWVVPFPGNTRGNCSLEPDKTQIIDPGTYGNVTIKARSHLKLRTGTYYFRALALDGDSLLDVDNTAGPVYVYVRDSFSFDGTVVPTSPNKPNLLLGYAGTTSLAIQRSFWGILVAPNASVTLASTGAAGHTGSFFAKTLTAQAATTIHHRAFGPSTFCPGQTTCSVLCPCGQGGSCESNADCQPGLSCVAGTCQPPNLDDGNPCTADGLDANGNVVHTPLPAGTSCADGNVCNGEEVCDASAQCLAGTAAAIDDGNPCTTDACTPGGGITHTPVTAGTSCGNGNACDGDEVCDATGVCTPGTPPSLDDGNPCTIDACDPAAGVSHTAVDEGTSCSDGNACNGAETCDASGSCGSGTPPVLDDGNPCTVDSCDPETGIQHVPVTAGTSCADADLCNGSETCDGAGTCVSGSPSQVDDGNPCTIDACDPQNGVSHVPVPVGTSCDDGDVCNGTNLCNATAVCVIGEPLVVDDQNPCTADSCDPVNGVVHVPLPLGTSCSDSNACNGDEVCNGNGVCLPGSAPSVDDQNPCTVDGCDPVSGVTHTPVAAGTSCADSDSCNGGETCDANGICTAGTPPNTDDGNPCTTDGCEPQIGVTHTPVAAGTSCADANPCNGDEACDGAGTCAPGTAPPTDDENPCTADSCDPAQGVLHVPVSAGTACADGDVCNGAESCDGIGACAAGTPLVVDDGNPCTADSCDPVGGVAHAPSPVGTACAAASCEGGLETGASACDGSGACVEGAIGECAPYACGAEACLESCATDGDCALGFVCQEGTCVSGPSEACVDDQECSTGACLNGFCCEEDVASFPFEAQDFDPTTVTDFVAQAAPLHSGANPTQSAQAGAIDPAHVSIVTGRVLSLDGTPLGCVPVSVVGAPDVGVTRSRSDGTYAIAVNGGGRVVVRFAVDGYVTAFRAVEPRWHEFAVAQDVRLVPHGPASPVSASATELTTVAGAVETDATGTRRATLLFEPGTTATVDGESTPRNDYAVRVKEVTNLAGTRDAMPAQLPVVSAFTYAVSLSVDGVEGTRVSFNKPIAVYVDNFLQFPNGETVPVGYFDETTAQWVASDNGRVIRIVSRNAAGEAQLDIDATAGVDDPSSLGIDSAEQIRLASLYPDGTSLWRFTVSHFSTWDANWGWGPDPNAQPPNQPDPDQPDDTCSPAPSPAPQPGSIIHCESQTLGERVSIAGTPFGLMYSSARQPGGTPPLEIPIASAPLPAGLRSIELEISVAGRLFRTSMAPPSPAQLPYRYPFQWDGKDAFGRRVYGRQRVTTAIGYTYGGSYQRTAGFGYNGSGVAITASRERFEATLWQRWSGWLDQWNARSSGLGGWSLDIHHALDPQSAVVYLGTGANLDGSQSVPKLVTIAGTGEAGFSGDGGPAIAARLSLEPSLSNSSLAVASDGTVYVADAANNRIRRIDRGGIITTFAGGGTATSSPHGDGGPATNATLATPTGVAVGEDGSVYVTDKYHHRIRKIDPSGTITTVAGTGQSSFNGDGPALTRNLNEPTGIALVADGTIYFTDNRLRRLKDGFVSVVPNAPVAYLTQPAVGKDGSIFFSNYGANRIQRIGVDGLLANYAGTGVQGASPYGEGGPAISAEISQPDGVAVGPDGLLYIADTGHNLIRRVNGDGTIETVVGTGTSTYNGENLPATRANISRARGLGIGPDGSIYVVDSVNQRIRKTALPPAFVMPDGSRSVASFDGRSVFVFSQQGRHQKTVNALTGVTELAFEYDTAGRLVSISDGELDDPARRITRVDRDASGRALGLVSPDGQYTVLEVDAGDDLRSITDPAGGVYSFDYAEGGILTGMRDPKGNAEGTAAYEFAYQGGRLVRDEDPLGHAQTLVRSSLPQGSRVTHTTSLGRVTVYDRQNTDTLLVEQRKTGPDGLTTQYLTRLDGKPFFTAPNGKSYSSQISRPDRSSVFIQLDPDPLFGTQAPVVSEQIEVMGTGTGVVTRTIQSSRSIVRAIAGDPRSVVQSNVTQSVNGRPTTSFFSAATQTLTVTSPAGRRVLRSIDERGRTVRTEVDGFLPTEFVYDAAGRLLHTVRGDRVTDFGYVESTDARNGYLARVTDALAQVTTYTPDALGRILEQTSGGLSTTFAFDPNGNLTAVTPPGRPAHAQSYTALNQLSSYTPPAAGLPNASTTYTYEADRNLSSIVRPDSTTIAHTYDAAGRIDTVGFGTSLIDYDYYSNVSGPGVAPGRVSAMRGPYGVDLTFGYLGQLTTNTAWSGLVQGSVTWSYDADFRKNVETVTGSTGTSTMRFGYDADNLLTCASPTSCAPVAADALRIVRHPKHGGITSVTLGSTSETLAYNDYGEIATRTVSYAGTPIYEVAYDTLTSPRDALGRVARKTETVQGATRIEEYAYDENGRLTDVDVDGIGATHWEYDGNGNRTSSTSSTSTASASYDEQDRLLEYGDWVFTYGENGELETKSSVSTGEMTTYQYDALGSLRRVTLPDATVIEYVADALGRRVAKRVNGTIVRRWLYRDTLKPIAELDGSGALVSRFVYGSPGPVPDMVVRGGDVYRIVSDQLGSPRLVVNVATGAIAQRLRHDEFGNVLEDTAAGFTPFGFAGGLYDPDTGLVRFGIRDYDPSVGRWTSKDPIRFVGSPANLYVYSRNDPVNRRDPSGRIDWGPLGGMCCNTSAGTEFAITGNGETKALSPGECTGFWEDCDGMTCGGGFYKIRNLDIAACNTPGQDDEPYDTRRWFPGCGDSGDPKQVSPGEIQTGEEGPGTLGGYGWQR